jgi:hypothetical protein
MCKFEIQVLTCLYSNISIFISGLCLVSQITRPALLKKCTFTHAVHCYPAATQHATEAPTHSSLLPPSSLHLPSQKPKPTRTAATGDRWPGTGGRKWRIEASREGRESVISRERRRWGTAVATRPGPTSLLQMSMVVVEGMLLYQPIPRVSLGERSDDDYCALLFSFGRWNLFWFDFLVCYVWFLGPKLVPLAWATARLYVWSIFFFLSRSFACLDSFSKAGIFKPYITFGYLFWEMDFIILHLVHRCVGRCGLLL